MPLRTRGDIHDFNGWKHQGGCRKTTLALNIAIARTIAGSDVLLIDGDEQHTAMAFTELRNSQLGSTGYTAVALHGTAIRTQVRQLAPKYADIVIDVGGRDTGSLRAALTVTDTLLIPVQPRSFDIWAIDQVAELVKEAREINPNMKAIAVINAADAQGHDNQDAANELRGAEGIEVLEISIGRRKAFPNAAAAGRAVNEQTPRDPKAVAELNALLKFLYH